MFVYCYSNEVLTSLNEYGSSIEYLQFLGDKMLEIFSLPANIIFIYTQSDDPISAEEKMHVAVIGPLIGDQFSREEVKHAIDLENDLALEAEVYESALQEGLNCKGDFESAETIEDADVHLALDRGLKGIQCLRSGLDVMVWVTVFYGGVKDGKAVDVGCVGFVELPEEVGQDWRYQFCLREEGEAFRVRPWQLLIAEMEVMRQDRITKILTFLVIHQSLLELLVSLDDFDDMPQQHQFAVFSLFSLPRNRKSPINRITVCDSLADVIQALANILLHDELQQCNCVLIFTQAIHSINLHQLPYKIMVKNKPILILNHLLLLHLQKHSIEPLLNQVHDLRVPIDLHRFLFELRGDHRHHKWKEMYRDGLEIGLKEVDDHVLHASPF